MAKRRNRKQQIPPQLIGYCMAALLVFVAASQSTDQYIFASWFVPPYIAHLLSFGMTGLLVVLLVAEQFHLTGFARWSSIFAIVLLLINQALVNVTVNMTIAEVDTRTLDLLQSVGLSKHQALLFLSFVQGAFRPLLEMLLWPVVAFVLTKGERAQFSFLRFGEQGEEGEKRAKQSSKQTPVAQREVILACEHEGCNYSAAQSVVDGDVEQALSKAKRRLTGHQNRMHGGKEHLAVSGNGAKVPKVEAA